jgi:hypothetical protein
MGADFHLMVYTHSVGIARIENAIYIHLLVYEDCSGYRVVAGGFAVHLIVASGLCIVLAAEGIFVEDVINEIVPSPAKVSMIPPRDCLCSADHAGE